MDVLVLGGSVFVGRAAVDEALAAGHRVTVFNRGRSGPTPAGAELVRGDRTVAADLAALAGRRFDVVIDSCGYLPIDVGRCAELLAPRCGHYAFVSTVNVYPGWPEDDDYHARGIHVGDPDAAAAQAELDGPAQYGWLKAGCELAVERAFGAGRWSVLRGGCIVGPHDSVTGRLPWWIDRIARGGDVLTPGGPSDEMSLIDARDLAGLALERVPGTHEATGPASTRGELMAICRDVTGSDAEFVWVGDEWLAGQTIEPWTEVPLWAGVGAPSVFRHHPSPALRHRPLRDTVAATWAWMRSVPGGWRPGARTPGMDPAREAVLLHEYRRHEGQV